MRRRGVSGFAIWIAVGLGAISAQSAPPPAQTPPPATQTPTPTPTPPRPAPFPGASQPPASTAAPAATAPAQTGGSPNLGAIDPRLALVPGYPGAEYLESFDAGKGQRLFVFGTNDPYARVVAFYKSQFKKTGEEVSRAPGIQQFDLGAFDSTGMAQRPSVIVKDYAWPQPTDYYIHVAGTAEKHFTTLIQIIPVAK